jgi:hypothetical protein
MTFAEWVQAVDTLVSAASAVTIDADMADRLRMEHAPHFTPGDAAWIVGPALVAVRISEDDAALRAYFLDRRDGLEDVQTRHHEETYVRSDDGVRKAANAINTYFTTELPN